MNQNPYYYNRISEAVKYIDANLGENISIKELAQVSGFSMYHFHRVFKAITGESPYESLLRLRLEKAIFLLKYRPNLKIGEIGFECGFSSPENFTRQFHSRFKISPSTFRKNKNLHNSRIYQECNPNDFYLRIENSRKQKTNHFKVAIESLPEIPIALTRAIFGADGTGLIEKYLELMDWAKVNHIKAIGALTRFGMSIDNPEVTPASKFRYDFALKIEGTYPASGNIGFGAIPKADYATVHVSGTLEKVAQAWDFLYKNWLPDSGYEPMHYPAIEEFIKGPEEIGWEQFDLKCRIPISKP